VARQQGSTATSHPLPTLDCFAWSRGFTEYLSVKTEHGVASQHRCDLRIANRIKRLMHRLSLGLSQQFHKLCWICMVDLRLINTADANPMRNSRLLQQAATRRRGGSKQEHGNTTQNNAP
jgi:hypothetical protein